MNPLNEHVTRLIRRDSLDFDVFGDDEKQKSTIQPGSTIYDYCLDVQTQAGQQLNMDEGKTPTFDDIFL